MRRRQFLIGASLSALVVGKPDLLAARVLRGTASGFNRGKGQVNLQGTSFLFLDFMKNASNWNYGGGPNSNGQVSPVAMDANGYPTDTTLTNGYFATVSIPPTQVYSGTYVVSWTGGGTTTVMRNPGTKTAGATTGANGTFTFQPNASSTSQSFSIGPSTIGSAPITSLTLVRSDQLSLFNAGKTFNPDYLAAIAEGNFGVIRFLNLQGNSMQTTWATRKPATYCTQSGQEYRSSIWAGVTTNSGNDYSISFTDPVYGSGAPVDKQTILLQWNVAATFNSGTVTFPGSNLINWTTHGLSAGDPVGFNNNFLPTGLSAGQTYFVSATNLSTNQFSISLTPGGAVYNYGTGASGTLVGVRLATLNLNSTGAIAVKVSYGSTPTGISAMPSPVSAGGQACWACLVYDADLNCWMMVGGATGSGSSGLPNGASYELMVQLCKEAGAHPWFVSPWTAVDPMTDFHAQLANYIKLNGSSWMIPRFEITNELWNNSNPQTQYAYNKAYAQWNVQFANGQFDASNWGGKIASTIGQAVNAVYGGAVGAGYQIINNSQGVTWTSASPGANAPRFTSSNYVAQSQAAQTLVIPSLSLTINFTKSAASNWLTHSTINNYFNPSERGSAQESTDATTFSANAAKIVGSIDNSGNLTVSSVSVGTITNGATVTDQYGKIISGTVITGGSGTAWTVNNPQVITAGTVMYCINSTAAALATAYIDTCGGAANNTTQPGNLAYCKTLYVNLFTYASSLTNNAGTALKMNFYEGGYSPDETSTAAINFLRDRSKTVSDGGIVIGGGTLANAVAVTGNYNDCIAAGGEFPSLFEMTGSGNIWGVLDPDIYAMPRTAQWTAIKTFNAP